MDIKTFEKADIKNTSTKKNNKLKIIFFVIGIILFISSICSICNTYKKDKDYELKGWETTTVTCTQENSYIKNSNNTRYYTREYLYVVSGQEYTQETVDVNSKPYKTIKYNPNNPYETEFYQEINTETIVIFFIGLIGIFNPIILKFVDTKMLNKHAKRIVKMSKRNIIKISTICFWVYLGISLTLVLKEIFSTTNWNQVATQYSQLEVIIECFTYIISRVILQNLLVILIYFGFRLGVNRFKKDKLSAIDLKKYESYYRDILKNYSPAELSYIDKFEVLPQNDIAATLLSLQLKKKISLENIIQINNNSEDNLSSNEAYVLDNIQNGKISNLNETDFITNIKKDAIKNGLLNESKIEWGKFTRVLIMDLIFIGLMIFICVSLFKDFIINPTNFADWKILISMFALLLIMYLPFSIGIYFYTYIIKSKRNSYIRTQKGEELNENLEGLKNYLKDFSNIHEKDEKSLTLWEDYLIYSVLFNQNSKTVKNIWDKYISI